MNNENLNEPEKKIIIEDDFTMFPGTIGEVQEEVKIPKSFIITEIIGLLFFGLSLLWTIQNLNIQCDTPACSLNSMVMVSISGIGVFVGAVIMLLGFWMLSKRKPETENQSQLINSLQRIEAEAVKKVEETKEETDDSSEEEKL